MIALLKLLLHLLLRARLIAVLGLGSYPGGQQMERQEKEGGQSIEATHVQHLYLSSILTFELRTPYLTQAEREFYLNLRSYRLGTTAQSSGTVQKHPIINSTA